MRPPDGIDTGWRVTARGLTPRYFLTELDAWRYAQTRAHLAPVTAWRQVHPNGATSPWHNLDDDTAEASA